MKALSTTGLAPLSAEACHASGAVVLGAAASAPAPTDADQRPVVAAAGAVVAQAAQRSAAALLAAQDPALARRLWDLSEELTGAKIRI